MINKKLFTVLTIVSLALLFMTSLLFMGCNFLGFEDTEGSFMKEMEPLLKEAQQASEKKQTEIAQTEAAEEVTEESAVSKEKRSFPDEPVTYYFEINECPITLTVNFKTAQITGLAKNPPFDDVIFTDGKIDLDNLEINTSASQVIDEDSSTTVLTITGKISDDFSTLSGVISNYEGASEEFTATR